MLSRGGDDGGARVVTALDRVACHVDSRPSCFRVTIEEEAMNDRRQWTILLIGGASGVGKTHVSYRLAQRFAVGITEIDDFQVILERMSTTVIRRTPGYNRSIRFEDAPITRT